MKHLLFLFIFSGSLDGFSQVVSTTQPLRQFDVTKLPICYHNTPDCRCNSGTVVQFGEPAPDTLRATLIVYYDNSPAILHTKPGFVVRQTGKDEVYLDDRKKVIKNLEVLTYKLKR
jgi:hypothetical protein